MNFNYFFLATLLFLLAQIARSLRWQLLLPQDSLNSKSHLLMFVSIGSLANTILPLHLGDIFRAFLLTKSEKIKFSLTLSSLVIERLTDLLLVICISAILFIYYENPFFLNFSVFFLIALIFLCLGCFVVKISKKFRILIYYITLIWNPAIQIRILDFFWSIVTQIKQAKFLSIRYLVLTCLMWLSYSISYLFLVAAIPNLTFVELWTIFHGNPIKGAPLSSITGESLELKISIALFLLLPILASLFYLTIRKRFAKDSLSAIFASKVSESLSQVNFGIQETFSGRQAYDNFLLSFFSGKDNALNKMGFVGFDDCKISRLFQGGSGAITALIIKKDGTSIRKVAEISQSEKLKDQYDWLIKNKLSNLPIVEVNKFYHADKFSFYEMPHYLGAVDLYEWLHTVSYKKAELMFLSIFEKLETHHLDNYEVKSSYGLLEQYHIEKVCNNFYFIKDIVNRVINIDKFIINGAEYSLEEWQFLLDFELVKQILDEDVQTDIHGDCTIENVIVDSINGWFFIDPNPTSGYKTSFMDFGKFFQSLHKGYESHNKNPLCEINFDEIKYFSARSDLYQKLHLVLVEKIRERYGDLGLKKVYLHEIIHYMRLLPYKFAKSEQIGMLFFAITCTLIREFKEKYGLS